MSVTVTLRNRYFPGESTRTKYVIDMYNYDNNTSAGMVQNPTILSNTP